MVDNREPHFVMFSTTHMATVFVVCLLIILLFISKGRWAIEPKSTQLMERIFAFTLLSMEVLYHVWAIGTGRWDISNSLSLELCSFSLLGAIILLWTGNRYLVDFVFFAGIGGALQAIATPVLDFEFPHFRYFHFFYTHSGIILTALYFMWFKGYRPTYKGIIKAMIILNVLLPLIFVVNILVDGNYMFLNTKPETGSLLDYLGPYPWYILSMEGAAFFVFLCLWLLFRKWNVKLKKG